MDLSENNPGQEQPTLECTLSGAARLTRAAEFDRLFTETVLRIEQPEPTLVRLELRPGPLTAGQAAQLFAAETACCSFFTFTLTLTAGSLLLDVAVPAANQLALDELAARAAACLPA
jgi:hypothetical protein